MFYEGFKYQGIQVKNEEVTLQGESSQHFSHKG